MRGARFVYTSETSYDIQLDEELVKRVTGKDTMTTRTLYEKPQWWIPQCAVWIATNNLPRFSSDGEAMWRRIKTIRFTNEFTDDGSSGYQAIPNIGRTLATEEGAGLFNLLLEALRRYRAAGRLVEPQELKDSVADHRAETDPLAQWVAYVQERGDLVEDPAAETNISHLRRANAYWCEDQGYHSLAAQRFGMSLAMLMKYTKRRSNGETLIVGWRWTGPTWNTSGQKREDWHDRVDP
jgi:putative DNA primase/helicase